MVAPYNAGGPDFFIPTNPYARGTVDPPRPPRTVVRTFVLAYRFQHGRRDRQRFKHLSRTAVMIREKSVLSAGRRIPTAAQSARITAKMEMETETEIVTGRTHLPDGLLASAPTTGMVRAKARGARDPRNGGPSRGARASRHRGQRKRREGRGYGGQRRRGGWDHGRGPVYCQADSSVCGSLVPCASPFGRKRVRLVRVGEGSY